MKQSDSTMVAVVVTGTRKVCYRQHRTIPLSLWEKYTRMCDEGNHSDTDFNNAFEHLVDDSNQSDWGDLDDLVIDQAPQPPRQSLAGKGER